MMMQNKSSFAFFCIIFFIISSLNVQSSSSSSISKNNQKQNDTSSSNSDLTASKLYKLDENPLRIGFEPFYKFTNMFIDNVMHFNLNSELIDYITNLNKNNVSMERLREHPNQLFEDLKRMYNQTDNLKFMFYFPFNLSTNFMILLIVCALFIILVPIAGLFLCICRLACSGKFNPYDRKYDSAKRKFYATIIFCLMVVLLLGSVILFFTNQNANNAIQKSSDIVVNAFRKYEELSTKDTVTYLNKLTDNFQSIKADSIPLIKDFSNKFNNDMLVEVNDLIKDADAFLDMKNETDSLEKDVKSIKSDLESLKDLNINQLDDIIDDAASKLSVTDSLKQLSSLSAMLDKFKQMKVNFTQTEAIEKTIKKFVDENLDKTINQISDVSDLLANNHSSSIKIALKESVTSVENFEAFYEIIYYVLMALCVFMLLWFILYSTGLAGLCARRANETYSQFFHRGVSANLLMTGVSFFFLFSSIIVAVCVVLYSPGIVTRQLISKPLISNDSNNQYVNKIINMLIPELNNTFSIHEIIDECRQNKTILNLKSRGQLLKTFLKIDLDELVSTSKFLKESVISKEVKKFQSTLNDKNEDYKKIRETIEQYLDKLTTNSFEQELDKIEQDISTIKNLADIPADQMDALAKLNRLELNVHKLNLKLVDIEKKQKLDLNKIKAKIDSILKDLSDENLFNNRIKQVLNDTINKLVMKDLLMADESPSCKPVAEIYDDIVKTYFFEFLDNFNTYWFILLLSIGIHMIVIGFAIELADLLRKHYAYDEVLTEDLMMEDTKFDNNNNNYTDGQLKDLYNVKSPSKLIDAYEISNMNRKTNAKSPPPQYRVPRA